MYHIFLAIALIAGQNQIEQAKKNFDQQKNIYLEKKQTSNTPNQPPSPPENSVIEEVKKQIENEEKAVRPTLAELESLGLDPVDNKTPKNNDEGFLTSSTQTIKPETKPEKKSDIDSDFANISNKADENKKIPTIAAEQPTIIAATDTTKKEETSATNKDSNITTKEVGEIIGKTFEQIKESRPVQAIAEIAKKAEQAVNKEEEKLEMPSKQEPVITASNEIKTDEIKPKKKTTKVKHKKSKIIKEEVESEDSKKERLEKLAAIRAEYFENDENDFIENTNRYQSIVSIVPQSKIPPRFINSDIPPPLLNRFRGQDNKHHPLIMSNSEKIDFAFKAIAENNIDDFNALLKLIKNPNIKNMQGDTLLTFAILMRRYDAVSSLLSKGANPELANNLGYTPLNIAIEMADYKLVSILSDMGANVKYVDSLGRTYLMQSSRVGSLPITDLLITKGIDVNTTDNNGVTALTIAYKHKKDVIVKFLLKNGAINLIKKSYIENESNMIEELFQKWQ